MGDELNILISSMLDENKSINNINAQIPLIQEKLKGLKLTLDTNSIEKSLTTIVNSFEKNINKITNSLNSSFSQLSGQIKSTNEQIQKIGSGSSDSNVRITGLQVALKNTVEDYKNGAIQIESFVSRMNSIIYSSKGNVKNDFVNIPEQQRYEYLLLLATESNKLNKSNGDSDAQREAALENQKIKVQDLLNQLNSFNTKFSQNISSSDSTALTQQIEQLRTLDPLSKEYARSLAQVQASLKQYTTTVQQNVKEEERLSKAMTDKEVIIGRLQTRLSTLQSSKYVTQEQINNATKMVGQLKNLEAGSTAFRNASKLASAEISNLATRGKTLNALATTFRTLSQLFLITSPIMVTRKVMTELIGTVNSLNKSMTEIQVVTGMSYDSVLKLRDGYNELGKSIGATTQQVMDAAIEYTRQGRTIAETQELIQSSVVGAKLSGIDTSSMTTYLTSAINGYGIAANNAMNIIDKLVAVDNTSASSMSELATAMSRTASTAQMAGVDINTLIGYIGTITSVTRKSAETVGESLKTIFTRFQDLKIGDFVEDGTVVSDVRKTLENVGIALMETETEFRDFGDVISDLSVKWGILTEVEKSSISKSLAGTRQRENFLVLMNNMSMATDLTTNALESNGLALERYDIYLESTEAKLNILKATLENAFINTIDSSFINGLIEFSTAIIDVTTNGRGLIPVLTALGVAFVGFKNIGNFKSMLTVASTMAEFQVASVGAIFVTEDLVVLTERLSIAETKLMLSIKGVNAETIKDVLAKKGATTAEIEELMATNANTTAKLTNVKATNLLTVAQTKLTAIISAHPYIAMATVAVAAIAAIIAITKEQEKRIQNTIDKSKELIDTYKEQKQTFESNSTSVSEFAEEYQTLAKGIDKLGNNIALTEEEFARYHEITEQIADMFPQMVQGYDDQGNAIIKNKGKVELLTEALKEQQRVANQALIDGGEDVFKGVKNEASPVQSDIDAINSAINALTNGEGVGSKSQAKEYLEEQGIQLESVNMLVGDIVSSLNTEEDKQKAILKLMQQQKSLTDKQEELYSRVGVSVQAYLSNFLNYTELNESQKAMVSSLANALDLSQFEGYEDANNWIRNEIITPIENNTGEVQEKLASLLSIDSTQLSAGEYKEQVEELVNQISQVLNMDSKDVMMAFGINVDYETVDTALIEIKDKLQNDIHNVYEDLKGLSIEDLKIAYRIEDIGNMTWDEILEHIAQVKDESEIKITVDTSVDGVIKSLSNLTKGFEKLASIRDDVLDKGSFDLSSLIDEDFVKEFGNVGDAYDNFIETVANSPSDINACQKAFDDLAGAYVYTSGILEQVTEDTKDLIIASLEQKGVANASAIVEQYLAAQLDDTGDAMTRYRIAKETANGTTLSTVGDLESLIALIQGLGVACNYLQEYARLKANVSLGEDLMEKGGTYIAAGKYMMDMNTKYMKDIESKALEELNQALNGTTTVNFEGSSDSKSGSKNDNGLSKLISEIQSGVDEVDSKISILKEKLSISELLGDTEEAKAINEQLGVLYGQRVEIVKSMKDDLEALKEKYSSEEDLLTIESAVNDSIKDYYSSYQTSLQHSIDLISSGYDKIVEGIDGTIEYTKFLMEQIPENSEQMLKQSLDLYDLYDMKLQERMKQREHLLTVEGLSIDSDVVKDLDEEIREIENTKFNLNLQNIDIRFSISNAVLDDADTLRKQLENAIAIADLGEDLELQTDLRVKVKDVTLEEIKATNSLVKQYEQLRDVEEVGSKAYIEYSKEINSLLEKQSSLIQEQISQNEELAKIFAEQKVYGSQGQEKWEANQNEQIKAIEDQISALENLNKEKDKQADIEKKILEIQEQELKLLELQNNKNIQILTKDENGDWNWDYISDYKAIQETESSINDKRLELEELYEEQRIQNQIDALEAQLDLLQQETEDKQAEYDKQYANQLKHDNDSLYQTIQAFKDLDKENKSGFNTVTTTVDTKLKSLYSSYDTGLNDILDNVKRKMQQIRDELNSVEGVDTSSVYSSSSSGSSTTLSSIFGTISNLISTNILGFSSGGLNTSTGLQLLHGTQNAPERVLSARQTQSFEELIDFLPQFENVKNSINELSSLSLVQNTSNTTNQPIIENMNISLPNVNDGYSFERDMRYIFTGLNQTARLDKAKK